MNRDTILEEIKKILDVLAERRSMGRPSYLTSVRKAVETLITLRLSEYVGFLDQHGLVIFDKKRNTLELTDQGDALISGTVPASLLEAISLHFAAAVTGGTPEPDELPEAGGQAAEPPAPPPAPARPAAEPPVSRPSFAEERRPPAPSGRSWSSPPPAPPGEAAEAAASPRPASPPSPPPVAPARSPVAAPAPTVPTAAVAAAPAPQAAPAARQPGRPVQTLPKRYDRKESLGAGGIGQVFEGVQILLDRPVAIKEIRNIFSYFPAARRQEIIDQIRDVASQHARLHHPFVVELVDLCLDEEFPFLVMEFCPGGSLRDKLKDQGRIKPKEATQLFVQVAEALAFAHRQGVLHRNLKPENILFDGFGNAKIADFGMNRIAEREDQKGQFYMGVGTVAYMSPEQFQDASHISVQSDLYSLGIILYEMLTGKLPGRRSPMPSDYFDDIPRDLDDIFDRMTMDVLEERYASVDQVLLDLYRSPAVLALLRQRGPALFTDTDLTSLPEMPEPAAPPARPAAASLGGQRSATPPPRVATGQRLAASPAAAASLPAQPAEQVTDETTSRVAPPPAAAAGERRPRVSGRLGKMADSLFGDD